MTRSSTGADLKRLAKALNRYRGEGVEERFLDERGKLEGRTDVQREAAAMRIAALEETVTAGLAHLPRAVERLGEIVEDEDPRNAINAIRTLLEIGQLIGTRTVNRIDGATTDGMTVGQIEYEIKRLQAVAASRLSADRVVSTQVPTRSEPEPQAKQ